MRLTIIAAILLACTMALTGCGDDNSDNGSSSSQSQQNQQNQQDQQNQSSTDLTKQEFDVAWQDALDDARDEFDGDVNKIELEPNDAGNYVYKIELLSDTQKFAMQVDATSGETVNKKTEDLESDERGAERREERIDLQKVIPLDKAMKTALDVQDGPVNKWKLEGDRGGAQYEFDIGTSNGEDREVQIDATSGEVKHDED